MKADVHMVTFQGFPTYSEGFLCFDLILGPYTRFLQKVDKNIKSSLNLQIGHMKGSWNQNLDKIAEMKIFIPVVCTSQELRRISF
jgi:hypothetical protein